MRLLILVSLVGFIVGCSFSYKPDVHDNDADIRFERKTQ